MESVRVLERCVSLQRNAERGCAGCSHAVRVCSSKKRSLSLGLSCIVPSISYMTIGLFVDTKYSNADGVVELDNSSLLFVEPHQTKENFVDFLKYVQQDSAAPIPSPPEIRNVKYAQTRTSLTTKLFSDHRQRQSSTDPGQRTTTSAPNTTPSSPTSQPTSPGPA